MTRFRHFCCSYNTCAVEFVAVLNFCRYCIDAKTADLHILAMQLICGCSCNNNKIYSYINDSSEISTAMGSCFELLIGQGKRRTTLFQPQQIHRYKPNYKLLQYSNIQTFDHQGQSQQFSTLQIVMTSAYRPASN